MTKPTSGVTFDATPYTDRGTGAYPTPSDAVTVEGAHDVSSTGAVATPGPVTVEVSTDVSSTGAYPTSGPTVHSSGIVPDAAQKAEEPAKAPKAAATKKRGS